jgi:hypothetical protein
MSRTTHLGEIEDGIVYTVARLAVIYNRSTTWVINTFVYPCDHHTREPLLDPETDEPLEGVRTFQTGNSDTWMIVGEDLRLWVQEMARKFHKKKRKPK